MAIMQRISDRRLEREGVEKCLQNSAAGLPSSPEMSSMPAATTDAPRTMRIGITDHLEGPARRPSGEIYAELAELVSIADEGGIDYFWFAEHHAHAHQGHLPAPLLLALYLANRTKRIRLGTAIICLNLHHPLAVAEQVAVADILAGERLVPGFGSGSTPEEFALFGQPETGEAERHARFAEALQIIQSAWAGRVGAELQTFFNVPPHETLPVAAPDLRQRSWLAVNSIESACIAGALGFHMLHSHLRTAAQYRQYAAAYRAAGGAGLIAANRPVYVAETDDIARRDAEPAIRMLWRRFRSEGKIPADMPEPSNLAPLCAHPLNFLVGSAQTVADQLCELNRQSPFDVANLEVRWDGLTHDQVRQSLRRVAIELQPRLVT